MDNSSARKCSNVVLQEIWSLKRARENPRKAAWLLDLVSIIKFNVFAADPTVEGYPRVGVFAPGVVRLAADYKRRVDTPQ